MKNNRKKWFKTAAIAAAVIILLAGIFLIYTLDYSKPDTAAFAALEDSKTVDVEQLDNMIIFTPKGSFSDEESSSDEGKTSDTGFAFYPGGKIDFRAYAPLMAGLAEQGITCVLLKMPFHLAVFDINAGNRAISAVPEITHWYIGGHSLGGVMASSFAAANAQKVDGIIFLASYSSSDINSSNLRVLSLHGSNDGVLNMKSFEAGKSKAPPDALYFEIPGGNHAGFGSYGSQKGDNPAAISADEQRKETIEAIVLFINGRDPSAAFAL